MTCTHYEGRQRCDAHAWWVIVSPSGARVPGGLTCEAHGRACIDEYATKLGQHWTLHPVDEHGTTCPGLIVHPATFFLAEKQLFS